MSKKSAFNDKDILNLLAAWYEAIIDDNNDPIRTINKIKTDASAIYTTMKSLNDPELVHYIEPMRQISIVSETESVTTIINQAIWHIIVKKRILDPNIFFCKFPYFKDPESIKYIIGSICSYSEKYLYTIEENHYIALINQAMKKKQPLQVIKETKEKKIGDNIPDFIEFLIINLRLHLFAAIIAIEEEGLDLHKFKVDDIYLPYFNNIDEIKYFVMLTTSYLLLTLELLNKPE